MISGLNSRPWFAAAARPRRSNDPSGMTEHQNPDPPGRISLLLGMARDGEEGAMKALFEAAYPELRSLARARLRRSQPSDRGAAAMLQTTMLVHEAYLKFASSGELQHQHRAH